MEEKQYYSHLCACGCGGKIEVLPCHGSHRIPKRIKGHQSGVKKLNGMTEGFVHKVRTKLSDFEKEMAKLDADDSLLTLPEHLLESEYYSKDVEIFNKQVDEVLKEE